MHRQSHLAMGEATTSRFSPSRSQELVRYERSPEPQLKSGIGVPFRKPETDLPQTPDFPTVSPFQTSSIEITPATSSQEDSSLPSSTPHLAGMEPWLQGTGDNNTMLHQDENQDIIDIFQDTDFSDLSSFDSLRREYALVETNTNEFDDTQLEMDLPGWDSNNLMNQFELELERSEAMVE